MGRKVDHAVATLSVGRRLGRFDTNLISCSMMPDSARIWQGRAKGECLSNEV